MPIGTRRRQPRPGSFRPTSRAGSISASAASRRRCCGSSHARTGRDVQGRAADGVGAALAPQEIADICASFQRVVVETPLDRTFEAARWLGARSVGISGGVSANSHLRAEAEIRASRAGIPVFVPPLSLSTDNAAMIGAAGFRRLALHGAADLSFNAEPTINIF